MDVLTLSSNLNISKPFYFLPHSSTKHQRPPRTHVFAVSCKATKLHEEDESSTNGNNLYKILCLSPNSATMDDIKRAYRSLALRYHPDVVVCNGGFKKEEATRMFVQVNAAYKTLSNPRLREEYDYELSVRSSSNKLGVISDCKSWRCRWQEQVVELKRRSHRNRESWASRMKAQNNMKNHN